MESFGVLLVAVLLYFIQLFVAVVREYRNATAIAALNLLLGWTVLGWIGSLV
ncbi:superinfection immunity protein [Aeromonas media]